MTIVLPRPGEVISYSFLWADEHEAGREEGVKTRPCVVVMSLLTATGDARIIVLPVTHSPPGKDAHAIEIPLVTKHRIGLDDARSWIILSEANRFMWPGPDIRPFDGPQGRTISYGFLPPSFFRVVRDNFLTLDATAKAAKCRELSEMLRSNLHLRSIKRCQSKPGMGWPTTWTQATARVSKRRPRDRIHSIASRIIVRNTRRPTPSKQ